MSGEHLVDASGRKEIHRVLTTHDNLKGAIAELQLTLGLSIPSLEPALAFLDLLQAPRAAVYRYLCDSLKDSLYNTIQTATPAVLEALLRVTFRFIAIPDLKLIPVSIIRTIPKIPDVYLRALADRRLRGNFNEFPLSVRRQILESSSEFFLEEVEPTLHKLAEIKDLEQRKSETEFGALCDLVAGSDRLFVIICDWLSKRVFSHGEVQWAAILRQMLIIIDTKGKKMKQFGKLHELARNLEECVMSRFFNLQMTTGIVRAIVTSQLSRGGTRPLNAAAVAPTSTSTSAGPAKAPVPSASARPAAPPKIERTAALAQAPAVPRSAAPKKPPAAAASAARSSKSAGTGADTISNLGGAQLIAVLQRAHKVLVQCDYNKWFRSPVVDAIAPGYSKTIKHPMDLSTMKAKIPTYKDFAAFESDIALICDNCNAYNGQGTLLGIYADDYMKAWRSKRAAILKSAAASVSTVSAGPSEPSKPSSSHEAKKKPVAATATATATATKPAAEPAEKKPVAAAAALPRAQFLEVLEEAWDALAELDDSGVFAAPVTDEIAPDYSKVVLNPMDMSTIQTKIFKYRSFNEFDEDVSLMIENCYTYNGRNSYYGDVASKLFDKWQKLASNFYIKCRETRPEADVPEMVSEEEEQESDESSHDEGSVASAMSVESDGSGDSQDEYKESEASKKRQLGTEREQSKPKRQKRGDGEKELAAPVSVAPAKAPPPVSTAGQKKVYSAPAVSGAMVSAISAGGEFEPMACRSTLSWAIALFCDPFIQGILVGRLASALVKVSSDSVNKIPSDDPSCRLLLQLCQLPATSEPCIPPIDLHLLRRYFPALMLHVLSVPAGGSSSPKEGSSAAAFTYQVREENDSSGLNETKISTVVRSIQTQVVKRLHSQQQAKNKV